jgi:hypothetical protein
MAPDACRDRRWRGSEAPAASATRRGSAGASAARLARGTRAGIVPPRPCTEPQATAGLDSCQTARPLRRWAVGACVYRDRPGTHHRPQGAGPPGERPRATPAGPPPGVERRQPACTRGGGTTSARAPAAPRRRTRPGGIRALTRQRTSRPRRHAGSRGRQHCLDAALWPVPPHLRRARARQAIDLRLGCQPPRLAAVIAVHPRPGHPGGGDTGPAGPGQHLWGQRGRGRTVPVLGHPRPGRLASAANTPRWQGSTRPAGPLSWWATPRAGGPCSRTPLSSCPSTAAGARRGARRSRRRSSRTLSAPPQARRHQGGQAYGVAAPLRSAGRHTPCREARVRRPGGQPTLAGVARLIRGGREGAVGRFVALAQGAVPRKASGTLRPRANDHSSCRPRLARRCDC